MMSLNSMTGYSSASVVAKNRVLRNTYGLLALSMVPTVAGAWIGVQLSLGLLFSSWTGLLLFMAIAFGFMYGISRNKDSGVGVALLLGFTFFMGIMLSGLLRAVLGFSNGPQLIMLAFAGTAAIMATMATIATVSSRNFGALGQWLTAAVLVMFFAGIANAFLHIPAMTLTLCVLGVIVFSAFLLFDVNRIVRGGETNYIMATLSIYLDLYNVFTSLLQLLGIFGGSRD
jgi:FtsH-binding integral membrane protein